jgi:hypothetical protein
MEIKSSYFFVGPQTVDCTDPSVPVKPPLCDDYVEGDPDSLPDLDFCGEDGDSGDDDDGSGDGDPDGDSGDDGSTGGEDDEGDGAGDDANADGGDGSTKSGCRVQGSEPAPWALLAGLTVLGLRLRRRH